MAVFLQKCGKLRFLFCNLKQLSLPADMFSHEENGPEPDWVVSEREQFDEFRDLNKDGKLDKDEIRHWILPQDYDHAQAEARHLVYESDKNKVFPLLLSSLIEGTKFR